MTPKHQPARGLTQGDAMTPPPTFHPETMRETWVGEDVAAGPGAAAAGGASVFRTRARYILLVNTTCARREPDLARGVRRTAHTAARCRARIGPTGFAGFSTVRPRV